jgi:hypothetical protein
LLILRLLLGIFFIILGICGVMKTVDEGVFSLGEGKYLTLEIIFGIIEIIAGAVLILGIFMAAAKNLTALSSLIILIVWIVRIVLTKFLGNIGAAFRSLESILAWLLVLSFELVIGAALLVIYKRYD